MAELELPVKVVPLDSDRNEALRRDFPNYGEDFFRTEPGNFVMGAEFWKSAKKIYNMEVRPDDVWIVTYPKCGTTWTQEMTWLIGNNCDFEGAKLPLPARSPFLEMSLLAGITADHQAQFRNMLPTVDDVANMPSPRFIKTHLPLRLLPPKLLETAKVIYVARNPKDVITSFYHHHKLIKIHDFVGNMEQFADYFIRDEIMFGSFFNHVIEAWEKREHPNLHYMFFEDMKKDLRCEIERLAAFMNKSLTEEQTLALVEHLSFKNFKNNPAVNAEFGKEMGFMHKEGNFVRKGEAGDWKNYFSDSMNERIDKWIEDNLAKTTLKFRLHA